MDPLSVPAPSPPFDMATVAAALPGHPGLVRARADAETGLGGRMSPSVYNHKVSGMVADLTWDEVRGVVGLSLFVRLIRRSQGGLRGTFVMVPW